jgi:membrane associated rhomboid family serine protease
LALLLAYDNAAILHWVPFIPQIAFEPWAHRGTGPKTPSKLPQTTIGLLAVVAGGAAIDWVTRGSSIGLGLDLSGAAVYPWQPLTHAFAPREGLLTLILQLAAIALISIPILRWYGRPGLLGITVASAVASGLVALGIALGIGPVGTSGGTMAIVLCLVAVVCNAGPLISGRILQDPRTALVLITGGVVALRWMDGDLARIPVDLTGVTVGLSFRRLQHILSGVSDWWQLRNPPPVKLYDLNAEDWN